LKNEASPQPVTEMFFQTFYFWLIVLFAPVVITMRLFALEKFSGTFETLMTAPVKEIQVVMAKFCAAVIFYMIMWLPVLPCLFILRQFTHSGLDAGTISGIFIGIFLVGCLYLSLGCFASSLTRSQMAAAMIALVPGIGLFFLGFLAKAIPAASQWQSQVIAYFSMFDQMEDFSRGVVDSRAVVLYLSATFLFLFLTLRAVESRRWK